MRQCLGCSGLVPEAVENCPNCEVSALARGVKTLVTAGTIAITTLAACAAPTPVYGVPCVSKQIDGGNNGCIGSCDTLLSDGGDPRRDPSNSCFTDGGTP
ncbi:MAG: hypothetical protein JNM17_02915 [Archangium sp.]|nr:hypothetical protein [Archangium sp.]